MYFYDVVMNADESILIDIQYKVFYDDFMDMKDMLSCYQFKKKEYKGALLNK